MAPSSSLFRPPPGASPPPSSASVPVNRRARLLRALGLALPALLLAGFLLLAWILFGDRLWPARPLEVATVVSLERTGAEPVPPPSAGAAEVPPLEAFAAAPLFQASGWIEADPFPVRAVALVDGVVDEVRVLEGQRVNEGEVLATLIAEDAEFALAAAEARLASEQAVVAGAEARAAAARAKLEAFDSRIAAGRARLEELQDVADRLTRAGQEAVPVGEIEQAAHRAAAQSAQVKALEAERGEWMAELEARRRAVEQARQEAEQARVDRDYRQLDLARTQIRSPIDGVVQRLLAAPGQKKMLRMDGEESATIALLYDPEHLQARIDVPLAEAAGLAVGQLVRIRSTVLPDLQIRGRVSRIVGEADLQRNTLQAKVALLDPDPRLRPEMLCRAEFLPPPTGGGMAAGPAHLPESGRGLHLFVPEGALAERAGDRAVVWTVDPLSDRLARREIRLGPDRRDNHLEVIDGLRPGARLVLNPPADLAPDERVRPRNR